jgi:hypothetical protein
MNRSKAVYARKGIGKIWWMPIAVLSYLAPAYGQHVDITPLIGARVGGSIDLQEEGQPQQARARLAESLTFGVAAGFRFFDEEGCEDCSVVEFRWMRENTHLGFKETTPVPTPLATTVSGRAAVTLDHYLADFTHEWNLDEAKSVRPFVVGSLGAARFSTSVSASTRFTFGLGAGVKIFPQRHWGVRLQVEYLPILMHADPQRVVCATTCVVALGGGLMNQFEFTAGPVFRF